MSHICPLRRRKAQNHMDIKMCIVLWSLPRAHHSDHSTVKLFDSCRVGKRLLRRLPSGPIVFKPLSQRKLFEHQIKLVNIHASISLHLHSWFGKNCWHSRAVKLLKVSCLPRDSSLNRSWPRWNYFLRQIKKNLKNISKQLLKTQATCIICLHR